MNLRADKIIIFALATMLPSFAQQAEEFSKNCATLSRPGTYPDYDPLPNYRIEKREYDAAQPPGLNLRISMPSRSLEGAAIIRVGCKLISDFQHENQIHALLFDDGAAARKLAPMLTDQHDHGIFLWHLKARFELNKTTARSIRGVRVAGIPRWIARPSKNQIHAFERPTGSWASVREFNPGSSFGVEEPRHEVSPAPKDVLTNANEEN